MLGIQVRELEKKEHTIWNNLVDESANGTIFHKYDWIRICSQLHNEKSKIYGCFKGDKLLGGCSLYTRKSNSLFQVASSVSNMTPYGGILLSKIDGDYRNCLKITNSIINQLARTIVAQNFDYVGLTSPPSFKDIRPFIWTGWNSAVSYAYYLDLDDFESKLSRSKRQDVKKAIRNEIIINKSHDIESYYRLYEETYRRQGLKPPAKKEYIDAIFNMIQNNRLGEMWIAQTNKEELAAAEIFIYDNKRAYRWSAATHTELRKTEASSLLLYNIFQDLRSKGIKEMNLMAANTQNLSEFIAGFNPRLVPYYKVELLNSKYKTAKAFRDIILAIKNAF